MVEAVGAESAGLQHVAAGFAEGSVIFDDLRLLMTSSHCSPTVSPP
jgi:hypothetical protein